MTYKSQYAFASVCALTAATVASTSLSQIVMSEPILTFVLAVSGFAAWAWYERAVNYREMWEHDERQREVMERDREYYGGIDIAEPPPRTRPLSHATLTNSEGGARAARRIFP